MKQILTTILIAVVSAAVTVTMSQFLAYGDTSPPVVESNSSEELQLPEKITIITPTSQPPPDQPVMIQIEHQGFPFDVNGNFPYIVTIDNTVYRYDKKIVAEFLQHAVWHEERLHAKEAKELLEKLSTN